MHDRNILFVLNKANKHVHVFKRVDPEVLYCVLKFLIELLLRDHEKTVVSLDNVPDCWGVLYERLHHAVNLRLVVWVCNDKQEQRLLLPPRPRD